MARTYVVTGAASGIGKSTVELLRQAGHTAIGLDLREGDVVADLSSPEGREQMIAEVTRVSGGTLDGVIAAAGVAADAVVTARTNYFGAVASLAGLRPLLARSSAPRAVVVGSVGGTSNFDPDLLEAFRLLDEARAVQIAEGLTQSHGVIYKTTKKAISRWVRTNAVTPEWAGAGIALNVVGPGMVRTPMIAAALASEEGRARLLEEFPMPLNGFVDPEAIARALIWLTDVQNTHITGQILFVDGGAEATRRGPEVI